ncbi:uncharacterized protein (TIGR00297 family) [Mycobacterium sp. MAA66]|uniref:DUF92 domain-containing protein n=1 Tax=Mycobacterium sp. MAA66 TaxID=3156297 RepID=UPI0035146CC3
MISPVWHDIIFGGGAVVLVALALMAVGRLLIRAGAGRLAARKIPHALCGVFVAVATYHLVNLSVAVGILSLTAVALVVAVERGLLPDILEGNRISDYGLVAFAVGVLVAAVAFWPDRVAISAGVLVLGLADASAALFGHRFGRHRVRVGQSVRSLEGSAAFAVVAFFISLAFTRVGMSLNIAESVAISVFIALTTACIELLVVSAADNLVITPWVALLLHLSRHLAPGEAQRWLLAATLAVAAAPVMFRLRWLDGPGAIGAALVTAVTIGLGGWTWIAPVATFFVLTSIITAYRREHREGSHQRGLSQVVVNGVIPVMIPVIGYAVTGDQIWMFAYIGGIAASTADSWASEIGRFSSRPPISLRTRRRVPGGTSGAVSALGLAATWFGGLAIGITGALISKPSLIVVGIAAGLVGSLLDSVLGATVQGRYRCPTCHAALEETRHCGGHTELSYGYRWIDNDVVNACANATGMGVALAVFGLVSL